MRIDALLFSVRLLRTRVARRLNLARTTYDISQLAGDTKAKSAYEAARVLFEGV